MSSGEFLTSKYEISSIPGQICYIRTQLETLQAIEGLGSTANNEPDGALTLPFSAHVTGGKRNLGIISRGVYLVLASGATPPEGYSPQARTFIPALTQEWYNDAVQSRTVQYLGTDWRVSGSRPESLR